MKEWTINVFVDVTGYCEFTEEWEKDLPVKARAKMNWLVREMENIKDWTQTNYFRPLTGYSGIYEIRFFIGNKQYRPLGCYGPDPKSFTLLIGAEEKGDKLTPKNAPWTAIKRRKMVEDRRYTREYY
jgi:hypothetical protein